MLHFRKGRRQITQPRSPNSPQCKLTEQAVPPYEARESHRHTLIQQLPKQSLKVDCEKLQLFKPLGPFDADATCILTPF